MQRVPLQVFEALTAATVPCIVNLAVIALATFLERFAPIPESSEPISPPARLRRYRRPPMLSLLDSSVILAALPYLFRQGMIFTSSLTVMAAVGGTSTGTLIALCRSSSSTDGTAIRSIRLPYHSHLVFVFYL